MGNVLSVKRRLNQDEWGDKSPVSLWHTYLMVQGRVYVMDIVPFHFVSWLTDAGQLCPVALHTPARHC